MKELRLRCLELAASISGTADEAVGNAESYLRFVLGESQHKPTTQPSGLPST